MDELNLTFSLESKRVDQKSRTSAPAICMSLGTLTVEANAVITKKMYGE